MGTQRRISMHRTALVLAPLLVAVPLGPSPAPAQVRVTPEKSKGGVKLGEPWAQVPETFRNPRIPEWPIPTDLQRWQEVERSRTRAILLQCLGELPPRPD